MAMTVNSIKEANSPSYVNNNFEPLKFNNSQPSDLQARLNNLNAPAAFKPEGVGGRLDIGGAGVPSMGSLASASTGGTPSAGTIS